MNKLTLNIIEIFLRPFYRTLTFFPLNLFQEYSVYFNKYYNFEKIYKISINKELQFYMLCRGDKGSIEMFLIIGRIYEQELTRFILEYLNKNDVFIDIGANIGYYSLLASKILEKNSNIYAFEPVKETYKRFQENIKLNKIENIEAYNFALGNKEHTLKIDLKRELGHNSIIDMNKDESIGKSEMIQVKKLDDFLILKNKNIFIKIDVEGYEFEVIKGMENIFKNNNCKIVFEFTPDFYKNLSNDYEHYCISFLDFLKRLNFKIYIIKKNKPFEIKDSHLFIRNLKDYQISLFVENFH